ncbi:EAL domain-containing protein [Tsuneonella sp. YG55]|uniref:EAL domain-containing protein n=1 Tax=Tsuneonella litorea TaxID=2976475 RepID=A0A9X2W2J2_9SPHN|nr:EAL domain-containing protein [Tsuneonella litorea]MCT2559409.1 EAL domain-containing protein [Tsuneonella litorea]
MHNRTLTFLLTSATAAMIALTACALYLIDRGTIALATGGSKIWPMVLTSSCATLLVMALLQDELRKMYRELADREEQARLDAHTDPLTGLGNRKFLFNELERLIPDSGTQTIALVLIDLDNFKRVNDTRGHLVGDGLIKAVAARLCVIHPDAVLIRLGGDEFALLVQTQHEKGLDEACQRLVEAFDEPFLADGEECMASGSLGAALLRPDLCPSELLRRADIAMYCAKRERCGFRLFDEEMSQVAARKASLATDLRYVIRSGQGLTTSFQGIYSPSGDLLAIEALLRWRHSTHGHVPPPEIIAVAEEIRLINDLALVVAKQSCRAAQACRGISVAMNVSPMQLLDCRFREELERIVEESNISAQRIQLEIREADFVDRGGGMREALAGLKRAGFKIAVDDFGASTSSLAHLQTLGVTILKLDPMVLRSSREVGSIAVMRAKVQLAQALGMKVVCEGVADEADRTAALLSGCDMLQGYLFEEPRELAAFVLAISKQAAA